VRVIAVIAAGGRGNRFGGGVPKQFADLAGKTVLAWTLAAFEGAADVDEIVVVSAPERAVQIRGMGGSKPLTVVPGGDTRQSSVYGGLIAAREYGAEIAVIHDAARPLVSPATIAANISAARRHGAAVTASPVADTLYLSDGAALRSVIPRAGLFAAATPQSFALTDIIAAHERAAAAGITDFTDDGSLFIDFGGGFPAVSPNTPENFKITYPGDLEFSELIIRSGYGEKVLP
jgi:2-C-methyl-D-erythritol 4-phosphate cytidylyltransferase